MALNTPKRIKTLVPYANSPPNSESSDKSPWNWTGSTSPTSSCGSPEFLVRRNGNGISSGQENRENKRGRPRSQALTTLMIEGYISPSAIKCRFCNRIFPREKSLQAHLRTHTGERPYTCDYPGCTRAFTQSGQLKTHQRLHTGERPFICSTPHCQMRFTHANRHCPDHPYDTLKRCDDFVIQSIPEQNSEVLKWLDKYRSERDRTPTTRKTPKRTKQNHNTNSNNDNSENCDDNIDLPNTPNAYKSRKGLMCELDMNAGMGSSSPLTTKSKPNLPKTIQWQEPSSQEEDSGDDCETPAQSTFNPKKKWLRDAWQDDLAKPLDAVSVTTSPTIITNLQTIPASTTSVIKPNPNEMRPTVLMIVSKDKATPLLDNIIKVSPKVNEQLFVSNNNNIVENTNYNDIIKQPEENRKWLGALALMQLAKDDELNKETIHSVITTAASTGATHINNEGGVGTDNVEHNDNRATTSYAQHHHDNHTYTDL